MPGSTTNAPPGQQWKNVESLVVALAFAVALALTLALALGPQRVRIHSGSFWAQQSSLANRFFPINLVYHLIIYFVFVRSSFVNLFRSAV